MLTQPLRLNKYIIPFYFTSDTTKTTYKAAEFLTRSGARVDSFQQFRRYTSKGGNGCAQSRKAVIKVEHPTPQTV